ncbi:hypothetical protein QTP70_032436 [Hemibagrus guttatus]|uniref:MHC class I antigen n=1 Tax=Hemibagrus guttatus TaxID=175788 RepID=A0AAE0Q6S5_9TELE|nr:hypothetical protein QTP70_032436 [Hemibagrus guttatus]
MLFNSVVKLKRFCCKLSSFPAETIPVSSYSITVPGRSQFSRGGVSRYRFLPQRGDDLLDEGRRGRERGRGVRETLPNQDGSFQKRSILKVPAEELQKHTYTCVIQHSSLKEELVLEVPKGGGLMAIIVGVVVALVVLVAVVAGIMVWKKNSGFKLITLNDPPLKCLPPPTHEV